MHETYTVTDTVFRETDTVGLKKRVIGARYGPGLMQPAHGVRAGRPPAEPVIDEKGMNDQ
jgi:hypothetical protein